jgi:acetyl-CoA acetyltransferase
MATITFTTTNSGFDLRAKLKAFGAATLATMNAYGERRSRSPQMQAMMAKTDEQLMSQYGIKRDQIAYYVFRDMMYC